MKFPTLSIAALGLAAALPAAAEDLTILARVTRDGGPPTTTTSYLGSDRVRIAQPEGQEMIVELKSGQMTLIDGRKKSYFIVTRQDLDRIRAKVQEQMNSPQMKKAQEQMKNLPPEMRKKMEDMMGGTAAAIDVRKGSPRKVAGYNCENWTISVGQVSKTEQCLTSELPLPVQAWDSYRDFAESMQSMMAAGPMAKGMAQMREKFKEMRGFPLAATHTTSVLGRTSKTSSEVTEVKRGPIPASAWDIPAGYKKVESPLTKGTASR